MRVRIKIAIDDAENMCRFLNTLANNTDNLLMKQQLQMDFVRLHNHLTTLNRRNGKKMTSFTLDGLTLASLQTDFALESLALFDEPNQFMVTYALRETLRSAECSLMKTRMRI